jgi:hypothetical protein
MLCLFDVLLEPPHVVEEDVSRVLAHAVGPGKLHLGVTMNMKSRLNILRRDFEIDGLFVECDFASLNE